MGIINKLSKLHKYGAAVSFLAMEIFALLAFSFGNNYVIYGAISLALMILLILFNIKEIKVDGVSSIAFFILPLFLFTLITALGTYMKAHAYRGDYNTAQLIFIPLGLIPIAFSGYLLSIDKTFKISTFLLVIYSALAILVLINLLVNLVNFGFFYTIIYKGYHMYYGGTMSDITVDHMAYTLEGLRFIEVKMEHYVLYPALLLTSSIALLFISPKENKKLFIIYSIFTGVALLSLILVPSILGLLVFLLAIIIDVVIYLVRKFPKVRKPFKIVLIVGLILAGLLLLTVILNNQDSISFVRNITSSNSLFNKLFNTNRYIVRYNALVNNVLTGDKFFGYAVDNAIELNEVHSSGSLVFDLFMMSGVVGVIAVIFMFFYGFRGFKKYFTTENDNFYVKAGLIAFVSMFIIYSLFFNEVEYAIYYTIYQPVFMTGPFMITLFIFCYVLSKGKEKIEETAKEESTNE